MNIQEFESEIQSLIDYDKIHKDIIKNQLEKFIKLYISTELITVPLTHGPYKIISLDIEISNKYNDENYSYYNRPVPNVIDQYNNAIICETVEPKEVWFFDKDDNYLKGFVPFAKWWWSNKKLRRILGRIEKFFDIEEGESYTISIDLNRIKSD